jgi:hypothetical protein
MISFHESKPGVLLKIYHDPRIVRSLGAVLIAAEKRKT